MVNETKSVAPKVHITISSIKCKSIALLLSGFLFTIQIVELNRKKKYEREGFLLIFLNFEY